MTVRLHTGDPSIYGAIREQMDLLEELGISAAAKDCGSRIRETEQLEKNLRELCAQLQAGPAGLVKLREALGWELGKLSSAIVDLQLQGYIEELQPGIYRLVSR